MYAKQAAPITSGAISLCTASAAEHDMRCEAPSAAAASEVFASSSQALQGSTTESRLTQVSVRGLLSQATDLNASKLSATSAPLTKVSTGSRNHSKRAARSALAASSISSSNSPACAVSCITPLSENSLPTPRDEVCTKISKATYSGDPVLYVANKVMVPFGLDDKRVEKLSRLYPSTLFESMSLALFDYPHWYTAAARSVLLTHMAVEYAGAICLGVKYVPGMCPRGLHYVHESHRAPHCASLFSDGARNNCQTMRNGACTSSDRTVVSLDFLGRQSINDIARIVAVFKRYVAFSLVAPDVAGEFFNGDLTYTRLDLGRVRYTIRGRHNLERFDEDDNLRFVDGATYGSGGIVFTVQIYRTNSCYMRFEFDRIADGETISAPYLVQITDWPLGRVYEYPTGDLILVDQMQIDQLGLVTPFRIRLEPVPLDRTIRNSIVSKATTDRWDDKVEKYLQLLIRDNKLSLNPNQATVLRLYLAYLVTLQSQTYSLLAPKVRLPTQLDLPKALAEQRAGLEVFWSRWGSFVNDYLRPIAAVIGVRTYVDSTGTFNCGWLNTGDEANVEVAAASTTDTTGWFTVAPKKYPYGIDLCVTTTSVHSRNLLSDGELYSYESPSAPCGYKMTSGVVIDMPIDYTKLRPGAEVIEFDSVEPKLIPLSVMVGIGFGPAPRVHHPGHHNQGIALIHRAFAAPVCECKFCNDAGLPPMVHDTPQTTRRIDELVDSLGAVLLENLARFLGLFQPVDPAHLNLGYKVVDLPQLQPCDEGIWLKNFPSSVAKKLVAAREMNAKDTETKAFIKLEHLFVPDEEGMNAVDKKKARLIQAGTPAYNMLVGPWISSVAAFFRVVWNINFPIYITGGAESSEVEGDFHAMAMTEPGSTQRYDLVEGDYSSFDSTQSAAWRQLCFSIYAKLGVPPNVIRVMQSKIVKSGTTRAGWKYKCEGTMGSGEPDTLLSNCIVNAVAALYAISRQYFPGDTEVESFRKILTRLPPTGVPLDEILIAHQELVGQAPVSLYVPDESPPGYMAIIDSGYTRVSNPISKRIGVWTPIHEFYIRVCGDDNLTYLRKDLANFYNASRHHLTIRDLGLINNLVQRGSQSEICSTLFYPYSSGFLLGPKIGKLAVKLGFISKPVGANVGLRRALYEKVYCLSLDVSFIPILSNLCDKMLQLCRDYASVDARPHAYKVHLESRGLRPDQAVMAFLCRRYDCSPNDIDSLCLEIDSITELPYDLHHPLICKIIRTDN